MTTKVEKVSLLPDAVRREAFAEASRFRGEFYETSALTSPARPVFPDPAEPALDEQAQLLPISPRPASTNAMDWTNFVKRDWTGCIVSRRSDSQEVGVSRQ
ncbi:hypothetical protein ACFW21_20235 [Streptomyces albogriseolus]|uniref:hypothetical protein n=1 Tax=Streptomyces albogriseolus TaxID=1887 RepID=UPI0036B1C6DA